MSSVGPQSPPGFLSNSIKTIENDLEKMENAISESPLIFNAASGQSHPHHRPKTFPWTQSFSQNVNNPNNP